LGVAIRSRGLAEFFTTVLRADMQLELDSTGGTATPSGMAREAPLQLLAAAPESMPVRLFPSAAFNPSGRISITPVLSPDNYMDVVPDFLASATRSVYVEQQYIRGGQPEIGRLLGAIRDAMETNPGLDVRIVVAKPFPGRDFAKEAKEITDLGEAYGLRMGTNVRS
jgi:hypothetical protein